MDEKLYDAKWCRCRYALLRNKVEGGYTILDTFEKRYQLLRRRVSEWAGVMEKLRVEVEGSRLIMITLTIAKIEDYSPGMIRDYVKSLKYRLGKDLYGFAWVAEIQARGAIHYHFMVMVPKYTRVPMPDKSGMWEWGSSKVEKAKTAYYLCVYIGKERQKDLSRYPKSCRTYAVSYRLPEGQTRAYFEGLRLSEKVRHDDKKLLPKVDSDWEYLSSTVSKGYAEKVLIPSYYEGSIKYG